MPLLSGASRLKGRMLKLRMEKRQRMAKRQRRRHKRNLLLKQKMRLKKPTKLKALCFPHLTPLCHLEFSTMEHYLSYYFQIIYCFLV